MAAPRKYPDEVRDRAIRLVRDLVDSGEDGITVTGACRRVGEQLGINTDTLRNWVKPALVEDGEEPGLSPNERARLAELEREVRELARRQHEAVLARSLVQAAYYTAAEGDSDQSSHLFSFQASGASLSPRELVEEEHP